MISVNELRKEFEQEDIPENIEILFSLFTCESYEGDAWILFRENGVLYEVNGSHCSCYGFEGQWSPEVTTPEAIKMRNLDEMYRYNELNEGGLEHAKEVINLL